MDVYFRLAVVPGEGLHGTSSTHRGFRQIRFPPAQRHRPPRSKIERSEVWDTLLFGVPAKHPRRVQLSAAKVVLLFDRGDLRVAPFPRTDRQCQPEQHEMARTRRLNRAGFVEVAEKHRSPDKKRRLGQRPKVHQRTRRLRLSQTMHPQRIPPRRPNKTSSPPPPSRAGFGLFSGGGAPGGARGAPARPPPAPAPNPPTEASLATKPQSPLSDLNRGPALYESAALPLS